MEKLLQQYYGPKGYGCSPESDCEGNRRMQSKEFVTFRLTKAKKDEIKSEFEGYDVEITKIDKTAKGKIRIWYRGETLWK